MEMNDEECVNYLESICGMLVAVVGIETIVRTRWY